MGKPDGREVHAGTHISQRVQKTVHCSRAVNKRGKCKSDAEMQSSGIAALIQNQERVRAEELTTWPSKVSQVPKVGNTVAILPA